MVADTGEVFDLCVVGTGIAGLNALFVASQYLPPGSRVAVIDQKSGVGGMWTRTYDFVRLHQPHRLFTAGDLPWELNRPAAYLANKSEVLFHLGRCMDHFRQTFQLVEHYDCAYQHHVEHGEDNVSVHCKSLKRGGGSIVVRTKKLIKCIGFNVPVSKPLALSSSMVRSITPEETKGLHPEIEASDRPIYIVGGGKTAMDTAHHLIQRFPGRAIHLIISRGVNFVKRETLYPKGLRRYWRGTTLLDLMREIAVRYDGTNEQDVVAFLKSKHTYNVHPDSDVCFFGLLSKEEHRVIQRGIGGVIRDRLIDVVDTPSGPMLQLQKQDPQALEAGSFIINCTGYLLRQPVCYEPFVSEAGAVLSIQPSSGLQAFTSFAAYFGTHLFYLGLLDKLDLYEIDFGALVQSSRQAFICVAAVHMMYNLTLIAENVPLKVMRQCGLDYNRWYPWHRQLAVLFKLKLNRHRDMAHYKAILDEATTRLGVRCGPVGTARRAA